jgi:hypothetical protein
MLAAQKQATESFKTTMEETRKQAPEPRPEKKEPSLGIQSVPAQQPSPGFGGKLAPPAAPQPEI